MAIPKNKVDRAVCEDEAHAEVLALRREKRTQELRLARLFNRIDRSVAYVYFACASLPDYGARFGYSPEEARAFALVGAALEIVPTLEEEILAGRLSFEAAAVVAKILVHPDLGKNVTEWLRLAGNNSLADLKRKVRLALAEAERKEPVIPRTMFFTEGDEKDFFEARGLACKREGRVLSEGEAVGIFSRLYLDTFDPLRAKPGTRRVPDTRLVDSRYVPIEVRRALWERTGGKCAVWRCERRWFIENAHLVGHAEGGHREAGNLQPLCVTHHAEHHAGLLIIEGTAENPIFKDAEGNLLPGGPGPPDTG